RISGHQRPNRRRRPTPTSHKASETTEHARHRGTETTEGLIVGAATEAQRARASSWLWAVGVGKWELRISFSGSGSPRPRANCRAHGRQPPAGASSLSPPD